MTEPLPPRAVAMARGPLRGSVRVPGSKSESQRAMVLAATAASPSVLVGVLDGHDTRHLATGLAACGARVDWQGDHVCIAPAPNLEEPCDGDPADPVAVEAGDGGTPARFMMAVAAALGAPITLDGSARLRERPMADGIRLLRALGARVDELALPGHLPIRVSGRISGGSISVGRLASSQFVSALMLVAPALRDDLCLTFDEPLPSEPYVRMTLDTLGTRGARLQCAGDRPSPLRSAAISCGRLPGGRFSIEPDASSAAYWWVAAAIVPGSALLVPGISASSSQPDLAVFRTLCRMGATPIESAEGLGIRAAGGLRGCDVNAAAFPDGALAIAVAMACASGESRLTGLHTLRGKESDRIEAMATVLRQLDVGVATGADWMSIQGLGRATQWDLGAPAATVVDPVRDHRIAMASAILGVGQVSRSPTPDAWPRAIPVSGMISAS
ncbi:MAG: 3-phosphoshikimate 1-carboxyvinyltransferase [Planctomycetota bacterium]|nr:3-phosphoshikimate 1-carboxyvinyltransferase [Planctomycetota bacterium]